MSGSYKLTGEISMLKFKELNKLCTLVKLMIMVYGSIWIYVDCGIQILNVFFITFRCYNCCKPISISGVTSYWYLDNEQLNQGTTEMKNDRTLNKTVKTAQKEQQVIEQHAQNGFLERIHTTEIISILSGTIKTIAYNIVFNF
ncbi:Hypothetical_protein [Hexamita inflata]|uniref:Hypothetical_protein n=1 Tax=Hexamita inflata TaxID=28002 RepID=A0AA86QJS8_9EUKA|nr:Hypothetical protein HINF_LOCUS47263 [Hexamita inflata]